ARCRNVFAILPALQLQGLSLSHPTDSSSTLPPPLLAISELQAAFGKNFFLSASTFLDGRSSLEATASLARFLGATVIASNEPLFHSPSRKALHDVMTCIRHRTCLEEAGLRLLPNAERYLKPVSLLAKLFRGHEDWMENTLG